MDFSEVRLYEPGDDVRNIDWRVTARTGKAHTKLFVEERERPVLFCVDCSDSMQFGTQGAFKSVIAARAMALLAWSAVKHGDRVGGLLFAGESHIELKPTGGKRGILKFFNHLITLNEQQLQKQQFSQAVDFRDTLLRLKRISRPGSLVYLISDFNGLQQQDLNLISQIAKHCDLVLIHVYDVLEKYAPPTGSYRVSDGNKSGILHVDKHHFQEKLSEQFNETISKLERIKRQYGVYSISIASNQDVKQILQGSLVNPAGITLST